MNLFTDSFYKVNAPPAVEINLHPSKLYTEEYSYLTKDELEVLILLATTEMTAQGLTSFSFSGIRRQLGKHQQKITKAINRLVSKELISKSGLGYSIAPKGASILSEIIKLQDAVDLTFPTSEYLEQRITFTETINSSEISQLLVGKWFGPFRYLSHSEGMVFVIRWQIVDSKTLAALTISDNEAILTVFPDQNDFQKFSFEEVLGELSNFIIGSIQTSLGVGATIVSEGWNYSSASEMDYQQRLTSWLGTYHQKLSEN